MSQENLQWLHFFCQSIPKELVFCHVILSLLDTVQVLLLDDLYFLYQDFSCLPSFYALVVTLFEDLMLNHFGNF